MKQAATCAIAIDSSIRRDDRSGDADRESVDPRTSDTSDIQSRPIDSIRLVQSGLGRQRRPR
jgi:hypothetical protein